MTLRCIACDGELESVIPEYVRKSWRITNQPYAGTRFTTVGHDGSTFFDPMDGSKIEINVCDNCLRDHDHPNYIERHPVPSQADEDRLAEVILVKWLAGSSPDPGDEEAARRVARYVLGQPTRTELDQEDDSDY